MVSDFQQGEISTHSEEMRQVVQSLSWRVPLDNVKFSHYAMSYESSLNSRRREIFRLFREKSFSCEDHLPV